MSWQVVFEHLFIVFLASALSIAIGLPLGILAYRLPHARGVILRVVDIFQTIPTLALLGVIMVFIGAGKTTVIIGITLYSLLPIVRNTCLGLDEVDEGIKEAARGMGMSPMYQQFAVELPMAMPTIMTGIRIAVVNAIGTAVFAAFVGGGGLGATITRSIRIHDMGMLLACTAALMVIAFCLDMLMGMFERRLEKKHVKKRRFVLPAVILAAAFAVVIPTQLMNVTADGSELKLYDGDYSETKVMARIVELLVESQSDIEVVIQDQMTQVNNYKSLIGDNHSCDMMTSYSGTLLTTFLGLDTSDIPEGQTLYDFVNEVAEEREQIHLLGKLGFDNTYAIAVTEAVAEQYGLETVSDLVPVAGQLRFGAEHEFFSMEGSMKYVPFTEFYGLNFASAVSVDPSLKYNAIEQGSFDVTEVYATDGLNRKAKLKVLEDDRSFFPEYDGAFLVRDDTLERFPELEGILAQLDGIISNDDMINMTYMIDVEGADVEQTAREFLISEGLLEG